MKTNNLTFKIGIKQINKLTFSNKLYDIKLYEKYK